MKEGRNDTLEEEEENISQVFEEVQSEMIAEKNDSGKNRYRDVFDEQIEMSNDAILNKLLHYMANIDM